MTKSELQKMKKQELINIAKQENIKISNDMAKDEIIDLILKDKINTKKTSETTKPSKKEKEVKNEKILEKEKIVQEESANVIAGKFDIKKEEKKSKTTQPQKDYVLPSSYGETKIMLMVKDPYWIYAYFEINQDTRVKFKLDDKENKKVIIRVYNTENKNYFDVNINDMAKNWYINVPECSKTYYAELGVLENNVFRAFARSNAVLTPSDKPSQKYEDKWIMQDMVAAEEMFKKSGGYIIHKQVGSEIVTEWISVPPGISSASGGISSFGVPTGISSAGVSSFGVPSGISSAGVSSFGVPSGISSAGVSSFGVSSGSGGMAVAEKPAKGKQRKFWAELHTELIVYGATEPDAKCTLGGIPIKLTPDGRFSIRFYLKDGEHPIPFVATSSDEVDTIEIVPFVTKSTTRREKKNKEF